MTLLLALALAIPSPGMTAQVGVGDRTTVNVESTLDLDIEVEDGSGKTTKLRSLVRKETFSQEVLEVAGGRASRVSLQCTASTLRKSGTGLPLTDPEATPLQGLTFTAVRTPKGWVAQGTNISEGVGFLGGWNDLGVLRPKEGAKEWKVSADKLAGLLTPSSLEAGEGTLNCAVESTDAGQVRVKFDGTIQGTTEDGSVVKLQVTVGRAVFTDSGKPVSLDVTGSLESVREIVENYIRQNENTEEQRKVGEIRVTSRKLQVSLSFS